MDVPCEPEPEPATGLPSACETDRRGLRSRADLDGDAGGVRKPALAPAPLWRSAPPEGRLRCDGRCLWCPCPFGVRGRASPFAVFALALVLVLDAEAAEALDALDTLDALDRLDAVDALDMLDIADVYELPLVERSMGGASGRERDGGAGVGVGVDADLDADPGVDPEPCVDVDAETRRTTRGSTDRSLSLASCFSRCGRDDADASPFGVGPDPASLAETEDDVPLSCFAFTSADACSSRGRTVSCDARGSTAVAAYTRERGICTRS